VARDVARAMRIASVGTLVALTALAAVAHGARAPKVVDLKKAERVTASTHGATIAAEFEWFCWTFAPTSSSGIPTIARLCVDTVARLPAPKLPIHARGAVTLRTGAPARAVHAVLESPMRRRIGRTIRGRRVNRRGTRWRVFLPRDLTNVRFVFAVVDYTVRVNGDQFGGEIPFVVGVRVHRHDELPRANPG
jgi:hypothetical protein